ncbi:MGMT family protein [Alloscardovia criceti]|uniref:MGMT family protein n=1 Tax=Alloscardovia criceti TaxID=356828 RepID=UPI0003A73C0A|nr:MGMT family protein [Alloscardovia criceti]
MSSHTQDSHLSSEQNSSASFSQRVYEVVRRIPRGKVATYGQIASLIGSPRSSRFVGFALHSNPEPGVIPCHRVVFKSGALAPGFAFGGPDRQYLLLKEEGVAFVEHDGQLRADLKHCQWQA